MSTAVFDLKEVQDTPGSRNSGMGRWLFGGLAAVSIVIPALDASAIGLAVAELSDAE
jgi:hypothetical protein